MRLCDGAVEEAARLVQEYQREGDSERLEMAELTLENLRGIKDSALTGILPRPSQGAGLGLTREVGEWAEGLPLMDLVEAVELYYRRNM
jgi:hypothetical protein